MTLEESSSLEELKQKYESLKEKYNLPDFTSLNTVFDVEDIELDTDFLLRRIRRVMIDRIAGYVRFIELILNPNNAPMFFFKLINKLTQSDKEILTQLYETLGKLEVEVLKLDLDYAEEKEAEFIKKLFQIFAQNIKTKLFEIVSKLENGENLQKKESSEGYFG